MSYWRSWTTSSIKYAIKMISILFLNIYLDKKTIVDELTPSTDENWVQIAILQFITVIQNIKDRESLSLTSRMYVYKFAHNSF
jgi:hypothetical protein